MTSDRFTELEIKRNTKMARKKQSIPSSAATPVPQKQKLPSRATPIPENLPAPQPSPYRSDPSNVFELYTTRGSVMRYWFDNLKNILGKADVNFVIKEDGIDVSHADENRNVVIVSKLFGKEFEFYRCDARIAAGVDIDKLSKIVHTVQPNEVLSMYIQHDKQGTLVISTSNVISGCETTFKYELIEEIPDEEFTMPDFAFPRSISISSQPFQKKLHDMEAHGVKLIAIQSIRNKLILRSYTADPIPVNVQFKGKLRIRSKKDESDPNSGEYHYIQVKDDDTTDSDMTSEIYQGVFNLKHICEFMKKPKPGGCEEMKFFIRNDLPLLIEFNVSTLGYLRIFVMEVKDALVS